MDRPIRDKQDRFCAYCGDWYQCRDHVIPHSSVTLSKTRSYSDKVVVAACALCNGILGDKVFESFEERADYLNWRYARKFRKLLNSPAWTEEEMEELNFTLRTFVISRQLKREIIVAKLANLKLTLQGFVPVRMSHTYAPVKVYRALLSDIHKKGQD